MSDKKIAVFGLGYVGSVISACLANRGFHVIGVDINPRKVEAINQGRSHIVEPGLEELIRQAVEEQTLVATDDSAWAVENTSLALVCVGTPIGEDGSIDLTALQNTCQSIGQSLHEGQDYLVVIKSTVPSGTTEHEVIRWLESSSGLRRGDGWDIAFNPEFLREGSAVQDFLNPPLTVVGTNSEEIAARVMSLYEGISGKQIVTTIKAAEMVKYASNAYHALKVTFANEIGALSKVLGIDGREVMRIFCEDHVLNISPAYLRPGFAFGGSCLPKDLKGLLWQFRQYAVEATLLESIMISDNAHIQRAERLIEAIGAREVSIFGISFKSGTDDLRDSPVIRLLSSLGKKGYKFLIYDRNLLSQRLTGQNLAYFQRYIGSNNGRLTDSISALARFGKVLVLFHEPIPGEDRLFDLLRPEQTIVDLVGSNRATLGPSKYIGMCW